MNSQQLTLFAAGSLNPARTCPAQERARALLASARDCGMSFGASLTSSGPSGSSSRTSPVVRAGTWTWSFPGWNSSVIKRFRSLCRQRMSALGTGEGACSLLLGTLTASDKIRSEQYRSGRAPTPREAAMLPTLSASPYGSNQGGAAGREGQPERPSLDTMARREMMPTIRASDADRGGRGELLHYVKGGSPRGILATMSARDATRGAGWTGPGRPLSEQVGGILNPTWCEWFMGFPMGWTAAEPSETRSSHSARRSSDGSSES